MDKTAFYRLSYGIYIVCSRDGARFNGQIANTVFQVTSDPPRVAVCINTQNLTHEYIMESGVFAVSVVARTAPMQFIGNFGFRSGRDVNKFERVNYRLGENGVPIVLDHTIAYIEVDVEHNLRCGTHTIFVGVVKECGLLNGYEEPMTYAYYQEVKRGKAPKTAPTYQEPPKKVEKMDRYTCSICGYIYDPEKGDSESGIKPGTRFEDLPADWACPVCGADKSKFEKES